MTTHTSTFRESGKRNIAKVFGVLFICAALFASALSLGLPHGSSAASNEVTLKPVADTFVSNRQPARSSGSSSRLDVRSEPTMRSFLRFEVKDIGQARVTNAHLRLFAIRGSQGQPIRR